MDDVIVKLKRLCKDAVMPRKGSDGAACFDVFATEEVFLPPEVVHMVSTGWAFEVPKGYELIVRPRSGLSFNNIRIANSPGTLDSDYRGELKILMCNEGKASYMVSAGDKIAQVKVEQLVPTVFREVEKLDQTERGERGFGSSGR